MAIYLDEFIKELLHLDDVRNNRLVDSGSDGDNIKSYRLIAEGGSSCGKMLEAIKSGIGKIGNRTVLKDSAIIRSGTDNPSAVKWLWRDLSGESDPRALDKFITEAYDVINLKGNNPLFLGLGALEWETVVSDEIKKVVSPLLIFPVKLIRGGATSSVEIEFVDDDAYFNPCLSEKMRRELSGYFSDNFPRPCGDGADIDEPLDIGKLDSGYFDRVEEHVRSCAGDNTAIAFDRDAVIIAQYNHSDICMYYDVRHNRESIEKHPLIRRIFGEQIPLPPAEGEGEPRFVLQKDSVQEDVVRRILRGESLIVKGPPGTGKTLTIANIVAALLSRGKRVLFASKKLSALAEVHAKLPENLRKFVMLLDCETEQRAALINPSEIKKEFKKLLKDRREYQFDQAVAINFERAAKEQAEAALDIDGYFNDVFKSGYYDAADAYFKSDLPVVRFIAPQDAAQINSSEYGELLSEVGSAAKYFEIMSKGGSVYDCPWFGVGNLKDTEGALALNSSICAGVSKILSVVGGDGLSLGDLYYLSDGGALSREDILKVLTVLDGEPYEKTDNLVKEYEKAKADCPEGFSFSGGDDGIFVSLAESGADLSLTNAELALVEKYGDIFGSMTKEIYSRICEAVEKIKGLERDKLACELDFLAVLDKLPREKYGEALKAYDCLSKFADGETPGLFGFKAKKLYKNLCGYSSVTPSFGDISGAIRNLKKYTDKSGEVLALKNVINKILGRRIDDDGFKYIGVITEKCGAEEYSDYIEKARKAQKALGICLEYCTAPEVFCIDALIKSRRAYELKEKLVAVVDGYCGRCGIESGDPVVTAKSVVAVLRAGVKFYGQPEKAADFLDNLRRADLASDIKAVANGLFAFGKKYFATRYTANPWAVTPERLKFFASQAEDRAILNAALCYHEILNGEKSVLCEFFAPVERGDIKIPSKRLGELFEHSFYALTLEYALNTLGKRRNGLGKNAELAYAKFEKAENEILKCNAAIIENLCMSRIDPDDTDFAFVNADRGAKKSLRYLFKTHADAILKLKRCFIMSPSTASVLMRPEEYSSFDVAIIDEASQLEPVNLLPVLVRAKQCVLVGDEYQMPPLTHFKVKNKRRIDDFDSELSVDTDISALSLALHNRAFKSSELACHYRSKTEALIAFSQHEFYPYMRTFPAAVPFGDGLGFEDVYTPDGCCDGGVNEVEAKKAVEKLGEHFDKYFDEKTGKLGKAVGIVAFGEAQLKAIKSLIPAPLDKKIQTAIENFDDLPEKLIFFRTIESVQGQETDRLILSLTYGRDKSGEVRLTFGELNRDALGKNIFNVAVTRAQSEITVIHSLTAAQISRNARIAFIGDYLNLVEKFASGGKRQFVSETPEKGANFAADVSKFIISCGIEPERVIINYGVTDGSVRIPVAVLSKDLSRAVLGVWCEFPVLKKYDYIDYNVRYVRSLINRGWNIHRIFIHEWLDNSKSEKQALKTALDNIK